MKLTVLGYYGGYPDHGIGTSSYLLESGTFKCLLDCGSGALLSLEQLMDPLMLDAVLVSHYHHDHVADLGVLQYYWQLHEERPNVETLPIYGPTSDPLQFGSLTWPHATVGHGYLPGNQLTVGPFDVTFLQTKHPVPAYAMRITERATKQVLVFTADTAAISELVPFAKSADLLLTDTNFFNDHAGIKWHLTAGESGQLAKDAGVAQLVLTHLPQQGDLDELVSQAQQTAGTIPVLRATLHHTFDI
ncbi:MBL fold metallo-hydrolase [Secundilactobacillus similis DSM 23365 = JCM 2765]|uniref:Beta-lactamase domain-containing protein n=1 Tax=Secundilactobacillus similis DSM 23365 = JCM 2765 TaxID=1423804 RepID=A0A0R2EQC2_9LACO|nr:MBL fold metallo-hydrolase [Secundilactobacillus similis]KRN15178.1 beta-lactamase domain-containing protein [Secundilactobacillus similis DSM 23365 = JCM 2765]